MRRDSLFAAGGIFIVCVVSGASLVGVLVILYGLLRIILK